MLNPCPVCKSTQLTAYYYTANEEYMIKCDNCGSKINGNSYLKVEDDWNTNTGIERKENA